MNTVINDIKAKLQAILEDIEKGNYDEDSNGFYDLTDNITEVNEIAIEEANRLEEEEIEEDNKMSDEEIKEQIADDNEDDVGEIKS